MGVQVPLPAPIQSQLASSGSTQNHFFGRRRPLIRVQQPFWGVAEALQNLALAFNTPRPVRATVPVHVVIADNHRGSYLLVPYHSGKHDSLAVHSIGRGFARASVVGLKSLDLLNQYAAMSCEGTAC